MPELGMSATILGLHNALTSLKKYLKHVGLIYDQNMGSLVSCELLYDQIKQG